MSTWAKDERGFTLIEMLVVVIVVGVLVAIAIPTFLNQREKAYIALVKSDVRNAVLADTVRGAGGGTLPVGTYAPGEELGDAENSFRVSSGVTVTVTAVTISGTHGALDATDTWSYDRTNGTYDSTGAFD